MSKYDPAFPMFWMDRYSTKVGGGLSKRELIAAIILAGRTQCTYDIAIQMADELLDKLYESTPKMEEVVSNDAEDDGN